LNKLEKSYVKIVFYIFSTGIKRFYGNNAESDEKNEKTYHKMLKMKQQVYNLYNFLIRGLNKNKDTYLIEIRFNNTRFFIRPLILSDVVMTSGVWEPYVKRMFVVKKGDVIIDVGAHIGTYTIPLALQVGANGKVIALEPNDKNADILEKNIKINKLSNIILVKKAAAKQTGMINLRLTSDPMLSMINSDADVDTTSVKTVDLDSLIDELSIVKVDWLKIDAEGFELEVLGGAKNILQKFTPKIIIETRQENQEKMKEILLRHGYHNIRHLSGEYFVAEIR
jgi:FkbM family methyltransferase